MFCEVPTFTGLLYVVSLTSLSYGGNSHFLLVMQNHSGGSAESLTVSDETDLRDEKSEVQHLKIKYLLERTELRSLMIYYRRSIRRWVFPFLKNKKDLLTSA